MAAVKSVLKKTTNKVTVRITATTASDTATIDLQTDCKMTNETLGDTQAVNISLAAYCGTSAKLVRNAVTVADFIGNGTHEVPQFAITDQNTHDIVVTFGGAGTLFLELTKVSGFNTPIEDASFGGGDNPTAVGS